MVTHDPTAPRGRLGADHAEVLAASMATFQPAHQKHTCRGDARQVPALAWLWLIASALAALLDVELQVAELLFVAADELA